MSLLTESARNQKCQIRLPGICKGEGVVFCHLNKLELGSGVAIKVLDFLGAYGCYTCHKECDQPTSDRFYVENVFYRAAFRTLIIMVESGVLLKYLLKHHND